MSASIPELLLASLHEVFGERDRPRRVAAMRRIFADDLAFADEDGVVVGIDAIDAKVESILAAAPGFVFSETGPVHQAQDLGVLTWAFGPQDGEAVVTGMDIVLVRDGLITSFHTVLTSSQH